MIVIQKAFFFFFTLCLLSCSSVWHHDKEKTALFPEGTYLQNVEIHLFKENKTFRFEGALKKEHEKLTFIGLSPLSLTLFKASITPSSEQLEIYFEEFKSYEGQIKKILPLLPKILYLTKEELDQDHHIAFGFGNFRLDLTVTENQIKICHERFEVFVGTKRYEKH